MSTVPVLDHLVGGAAFAGSGTRLAAVHDPALGTVRRHVRLASTADVDAAVASAEEGSRVEDRHHAPGTLEPGESRVERMADVVDADDDGAPGQGR